MSELRQITTRIDPEINRRLRQLSLDTERPIYDLVNEALDEYLDRQERGEERQRA